LEHEYASVAVRGIPATVWLPLKVPLSVLPLTVVVPLVTTIVMHVCPLSTVAVSPCTEYFNAHSSPPPDPVAVIEPSAFSTTTSVTVDVLDGTEQDQVPTKAPGPPLPPQPTADTARTRQPAESPARIGRC
jgi:hypothetical protein